MLLQHTISQLDIGRVPPALARQMGQMGYLQWLGALDGDASYPGEALRAFVAAQPYRQNSPAVAVFCDLLVASVETPLNALHVLPPAPRRRGGARARRMSFRAGR